MKRSVVLATRQSAILSMRRSPVMCVQRSRALKEEKSSVEDDSLWDKFKKQFVVGEDYKHYLPPQYSSKDEPMKYRYPAPGSQEGASQPLLDTGADPYKTKHYNHHEVELANAPELDGYTPTHHLEYPWHVPKPTWTKNEETMWRLLKGSVDQGIPRLGDCMHNLDEDGSMGFKAIEELYPEIQQDYYETYESVQKGRAKTTEWALLEASSGATGRTKYGRHLPANLEATVIAEMEYKAEEEAERLAEEASKAKA